MFFFYYCNTLTVVGGEAHIMDDLSWSIRAKERPTLTLLLLCAHVYTFKSDERETFRSRSDSRRRERERERQWNPRDGSYHSTPLLFHWGAATTTTTTDAASSFLESKELCKYDLLTAEKRLQSLFLSLSLISTVSF